MSRAETTVWLFKGVPLDPTYTDTYLPANASAQLTFMNQYLYRTFTNCQYQNPYMGIDRQTQSITLAIEAEDIDGVNYLGFQNETNGRIYWCFVSAYQSKSVNTTTLFYDIDYFQTFWLNCSLKSSFTVREHVGSANDNPTFWGPNEALSTSGFVRGNYALIRDSEEVKVYMFFNPPSRDTDPDSPYQAYVRWKQEFVDPSDRKMTKVTNVVSQGVGCGLEVYQGTSFANFNLAVFGIEGAFTNTLAYWGLLGHISRIVLTTTSYGTTDTQRTETVQSGWSPNFGSYTPVNKKCHSEPYRKYVFGSYDGSTMEMPFMEVYKNDGAKVIYGTINSINGGKYLRVISGSKDQQIFAISDVDLPVSSDAGREELQQLRLAEQAQTASAIISTVGSLAMVAGTAGLFGVGGAAGAMAGFGKAAVGGAINMGASLANNTVSNKLAQGQANARGITTVVPSVGNAMIDLCQNRIGFYFQIFEAPEADMRRIDNFFTCYGYEVDTYKVPNLTGMSNYNYVQTNGAVITGNAPAPAIAAIKQIFNNGVRLWHTNINLENLTNNVRNENF